MISTAPSASVATIFHWSALVMVGSCARSARSFWIKAIWLAVAFVIVLVSCGFVDMYSLPLLNSV